MISVFNFLLFSKFWLSQFSSRSRIERTRRDFMAISPVDVCIVNKRYRVNGRDNVSTVVVTRWRGFPTPGYKVQTFIRRRVTCVDNRPCKNVGETFTSAQSIYRVRDLYHGQVNTPGGRTCVIFAENHSVIFIIAPPVPFSVTCFGCNLFSTAIRGTDTGREFRVLLSSWTARNTEPGMTTRKLG